MKPDGDKERKSACPVALAVCALLKWKHDCISTKLVSVSFPLHQKDCLLDLTTVLLYHIFLVSMQTFDAVGEWCHLWSIVLKRWKCLPWGNHVLLHRAQLLFSPWCFTTCKSCLYRWYNFHSAGSFNLQCLLSVLAFESFNTVSVKGAA